MLKLIGSVALSAAFAAAMVGCHNKDQDMDNDHSMSHSSSSSGLYAALST